MKKIIFWCEFPEKVDLSKLSSVLGNLNIDIYIASKNLNEFKKFKERFSKIKKIKTIGCWPVLDKNQGYWYSGFTDDGLLNSLLEFKGLKLKIDIEPPIEHKKFSYFGILYWIVKYCLFKKSLNKDLLSDVLNKLNKENLIISTFPLPKFALKNLINLKDLRNSNLNLMYYSSLIPSILRPFYRFYFEFIFNNYKRLTKNIFVAVGLIGTGIFGNEPTYKSLNEFKKDLEFVKELKVNSIVVFELSGILKRKDYEEWFKVILDYI